MKYNLQSMKHWTGCSTYKTYHFVSKMYNFITCLLLCILNIRLIKTYIQKN